MSLTRLTPSDTEVDSTFLSLLTTRHTDKGTLTSPSTDLGRGHRLRRPSHLSSRFRPLVVPLVCPVDGSPPSRRGIGSKLGVVWAWREMDSVLEDLGVSELCRCGPRV